MSTSTPTPVNATKHARARAFDLFKMKMCTDPDWSEEDIQQLVSNNKKHFDKVSRTIWFETLMHALGSMATPFFFKGCQCVHLSLDTPPHKTVSLHCIAAILRFLRLDSLPKTRITQLFTRIHILMVNHINDLQSYHVNNPSPRVLREMALAEYVVNLMVLFMDQKNFLEAFKWMDTDHHCPMWVSILAEIEEYFFRDRVYAVDLALRLLERPFWKKYIIDHVFDHFKPANFLVPLCANPMGAALHHTFRTKELFTHFMLQYNANVTHKGIMDKTPVDLEVVDSYCRRSHQEWETIQVLADEEMPVQDRFNLWITISLVNWISDTTTLHPEIGAMLDGVAVDLSEHIVSSSVVAIIITYITNIPLEEWQPAYETRIHSRATSFLKQHAMQRQRSIDADLMICS